MEDKKGTGRTTARILHVIGYAIDNPCVEFEFEDHCHTSVEDAFCLRKKIEEVIKNLKLQDIEVWVSGSKVFVKSMFRQRSVEEEAYKETMGFYPNKAIEGIELERMVSFSKIYARLKK